MIGKTFDGLEVWIEDDHSITVWRSGLPPLADPVIRTQRPEELADLLLRASGVRREQMHDRLYPPRAGEM